MTYEKELLSICIECGNEDYALDLINGICNDCYIEAMEKDKRWDED